MEQPPHEDILTVPALVGAYSVAGIYIQRALRGSSGDLPLEHVLLLGGTSALASFATPMLTRPFMCEYRPLTPVADAAVSSALVYGLLRFESVGAEEAAMFLPIQVVSSLLAHYVKHYMWKEKKQRSKKQHSFQ
jgi:hypothetical protein